MAIYVTGDIHSDVFSRLNKFSFPEQKDLTRDDIVIILGDFGVIWNYMGLTDEERHKLDWLSSAPFTTCFIDGNHENFERLNQYPISTWNGGKVHEIVPHVYHLMRGEIYNIEGLNFFVMGGAKSQDIKDGIIPFSDDWRTVADRWAYKEGKRFFRVDKVSYWKEELPSKEEYNNAIVNLEKINYNVDFVLSHCAPSFVETLINIGFKHDVLTNWFNDLIYEKNLKFKKWFFGHYHDDKSYGDYILLFEQIVQIH